MQRVNNVIRRERDATALEAVTLDSEALTTICELDCLPLKDVFFTFANAGNALDQFEVQLQADPDGAFVAVKSAAGDFTTAADFVFAASGDLTALADATTGWLALTNVMGYALRIQAARAAGADTVVTPYVCARTLG